MLINHTQLNNYNSQDRPQYTFQLNANSFMVCLGRPYYNRHNHLSYPVKAISFNQSLYFDMEYLLEEIHKKNSRIIFLLVFKDIDSFQKDYKHNYYDLKHKSCFIYLSTIQFSDWINDNKDDLNNIIIVFNNFKNWSEIKQHVYLYGRTHLEGTSSTTRHLFDNLTLRMADFLTLISYNNLSNLSNLIIEDRSVFKPKLDMVHVDSYIIKQEKLGSTMFIDNIYYKYKDTAIDTQNWRDSTKHISQYLHTNNVSKINRDINSGYKNTPLSNNLNHTQNRNFSTSSRTNLKDRLNVYSELGLIINNNPVNEETQMKIEDYLLRYEYVNFDPEKIVLGINTGYFNKNLIEYLLNYHNLLNIKIKKFVDNGDQYIPEKDKPQYYLTLLIKVVGIKYIISVIFGRFLRIVTNQKSNLSNIKNLALDIMYDIGQDIIREYCTVLYLKKKKELNSTNCNIVYLLSDWRKENINIIEDLNHIDLKISIGAIIVEWMIDIDLLRKTYSYSSDKKLHNLFIPSTKAIEEISKLETLVSTENSSKKLKIKDFCYSLPLRLPMICKPKLYSINSEGKLKLGGYLSNDEKYVQDIFLDNYEFKIGTVIEKKNIIIDLINNVNSVGYKINTSVLDFINKYPNHFGLELMDPDFEHPLSKLSRVKSLNKKDNKELIRYYSKLDLQQNILNIAHTYSQLNEFYLIVRLDSRGRLYCITEYLNYQSNELAKSLLWFSKPSLISKTDHTGIDYLKAYGVNCFGNKIDKLSLNEKIKWIDENLSDIKNFSNGKLIKQADNKFLFTAFCFEYNRWLDFDNDPNAQHFYSYLPIQLDATCNGYQHLALLSLDTNLGQQLNLSESTFNDKPKDFYTYLLIELMEEFNTKLKSEQLDDTTKGTYARLNNFSFQRSVIKKCIMTIPYNATNPKLIDYIKDNFTRWVDENGNEWFSISPNSDSKLSYDDISILVKGIRKVLTKCFPQLTKLVEYLKQIAQICTKLEIAIPWTLPSGLRVSQSYLATKSVQLTPFTYSNTKFSLNTYLSNYDKKKQIRAFMPNLIHSLDATTLAILVTDYFKSEFNNHNIFTVHDCFGVNINHIEYIIDLLKVCYLKLYSDEKYLLTLNNEIIRNIILNFGRNSFDEKTLIIKTDTLTLKFPDINKVLTKGISYDFESLKKSVYPLI